MTSLLTASRLKAARSCKRLHHLQYDLGYRPLREDEALRFGTLFHRALEAWWRATGVAERLEMALAVIDEAEADPFDKAKARVLLIGYDTRWGSEPYDVLEVEAEFEAPLRNPETGYPSQTWKLAGKIDAIVRDRRDGLVKLVEHKTTVGPIDPGSEYWRRLRLDGQLSAYWDGAASLGHKVASCVYDVILKPALRPLKATPLESRKYTKDGKLYATQRAEDETPEEYEARLTEAVAQAPDRFYGRAEVVRLEAEMDEARFDAWQTAKEIREGQVANRFPRNPDACLQYGRTCPFFDACSGAASLEDRTLYTRLDNVHPELSHQSAKEERPCQQ